MHAYRFITKRCIASKIVKQSTGTIYFNRSSRQFCIAQQTVNSPEISDEQEQRDQHEYFESLKQKSLLSDDNVESNKEFRYKQKQQTHYERYKAKTERGAQHEKYPEIFRLINNATSGEQIKDCVIDYVNKHETSWIQSYDQSKCIQAIENLTKLAQSPDEIKEDNDNEIESKQNNYTVRLPAVFTHGMRACFNLREHKYGWELYKIARQKNFVSNDLYSMVLFGKMHESQTNQSLKECFDVFDEWREESKIGGLHLNAKIYGSLLGSCMKTKNFGKAFHVYNNLMVRDLDENEFKKILQSPSLRQEIVNLYCKAQGVEAAIKFVSDCKVKYGFLPTQLILSMLISACAGEVSQNPNLVEVAQKLFVSAFDAITSDNSCDVELKVFSALLVVYSKSGDYKSCIDLLNEMGDKEDWPNPNAYCITPALKSISIYNVKMGNENKDMLLTSKKKWELIENILGIQKKNNLPQDGITYSILFHACDGNRDKMMKLYNEMIRKDKIIPNQLVLQNVLLGGLDGFIEEIKLKIDNNESISKLVDTDVTAWVDWVLMEMNKYHLPVSETTRFRLKTKLDIIKSLQ